MAARKAAVIYARVSSERQRDNWSIDAQVECVRSYCAAHDIEVVDVFTDVGSGKNMNREGLQQALLCIKGSEVNVLVAWRFNRLSRNTSDLMMILNACHDQDVDVISISEPVSEGPTGRLQTQLFAIMGELERRIISENQSIAYASKQRQGKPLSAKMPLGYKWNKASQTITVVETDAVVVRNIFNLYLHEGYGYRKISQVMLKRFGRRMSPASIQVILKNKRYTGNVSNVYGEALSVYPALITVADYDAVQVLRRSRTKPRQPRPHRLKQRLLCPYCHRHLTTAHAGGYDYYECLCQRPRFSMRRDDIEARLWGLVDRINWPEPVPLKKRAPQVVGLERQRIIQRFEAGDLDLAGLKQSLAEWQDQQDARQQLELGQSNPSWRRPATADEMFSLVDHVTFKKDGGIQGVFMIWRSTVNVLKEVVKS